MTNYHNDLLDVAIVAALNAGKAILEIYHSKDFEIELKSDQSPLTKADREAHHIISNTLRPLGIPLLSEESVVTPYQVRKAWTKFWLVDPLDGTKEFIKRNGEFTVNIALIEDKNPVLGVVYAPVNDVLYYGEQHLGAFRIVHASSEKWQKNLAGCKLPDNIHSTPGIVVSRSHLNPETSVFIEGLKRKYPDARIVTRGSSLKICMIAEGEADIYPRFAPTNEWDTAAGHAVLKAAGGYIKVAGSNTQSITYNKESMLNPWFIAGRKESY